MISKRFVPFLYVDNFLGVNAKDSTENMLDGELNQNSINVFSDPQGAIGSRPGYTGLTSISIGSTTAWCGFYHFRKLSDNTDHYIGGATNGAMYKYSAGDYVTLATGLTITADTRVRFDDLNSMCVITINNNLPRVYDGSSIGTLGGTIVTADICLESWSYMWLHSTLDENLLYYSGSINSVESGYTNFINFSETSFGINGVCKQGDDMVVSKLWSLFRLQYTGDTPAFNKYQIPSKVGAISHDVMKELPDGRMMFLAPDFEVYMLTGDNLTPVGNNIREIIKAGVHSRLQYAVAGLLLNRSQYWLSFTYVSNSTENDRTLVMDWSRAYRDKWGKIQYPWFIYSIGANCFAEVYLTGKAWLYHGGYVGKMYKDDYGTNDDGAAFVSNAITKIFSHGDPSIEKKYGKLLLSYENKGSHNLDISIVCDKNSSTEKIINQSMVGAGVSVPLFDSAYFDVDYFASSSDAEIGRDIYRQGKLIQMTMGTDGLDEAWNVLNYSILAKPLKRGIRGRES